MTKKIGLLVTLTKRLLFFSIPLVIAVLMTARVKTENVVPPAQKETRIISRALHFIKKNYVDPNLLDGDRLLRKTVREMERGIAPLRIGLKDQSIHVSVADKEGKIPITSPISFDSLTPILRQILGFLDEHYQGPVEEKDREYLALNGIVSGLDPHSNFLPPKIYNEFKIGTKGNFGGLGIVIGIRDAQLTVISPIEGTPAYEVGIRANDKIIQIGEEAAINMSLTEAVEKLRGPVGSLASLVIQRPDSPAPIHVSLKRALIHIKSVGATLLPPGKSPEGKAAPGQVALGQIAPGQVALGQIAPGQVALIKIKNFQEDTAQEVERQLKKILSQNPKLKGAILDLRNDPGGLLDQSVEVSDFFLKDGLIVKTVGAETQLTETEVAHLGGPFEDLPIAVLVNEGSASAAEIVAGALQQNDRACVLGTRSFGKGSVQTVFDLKDGSALKLTIAKYLTANDYVVQSVGITPDINLIPETVGVNRVDLFENVKTREDDLRDRLDEVERSPTPLPASRFNLKYLAVEKKDESEPDENAGKIVLDQDTPVRLAQDLLLLKEEATRCSDLTEENISSLTQRWALEEDEKLEKALGKIGVLWAKGKKVGKPEAQITLELTDEQGKPLASLLPGQTGKVHMVVENKGSGPFYRLAAVTQTDDPLFANLEFPFGQINPGEKREWTATLKIPELVSERSEPVTFVFYELYDRTPPNQEPILSIAEPAHPHFTYRYQIIDGQENGTKGNKNHIPEKGEIVGIKVEVKNEGPGTSTKPVINLKNNGGEEVFLEKGRLELGPLAPGEKTTGMFLVQIHSIPPEKIDLELSINDAHLGADLVDHMIWKNETVTPSPDQEFIPPRLTLEPNVPLLLTSGSSYSVKGTARDDLKLQHVFIFVNAEKAFYQPQKSEGNSLAFTTNLKLKKGINVITVIAQDDRDLTTQRQWAVWRKK